MLMCKMRDWDNDGLGWEMVFMKCQVNRVSVKKKLSICTCIRADGVETGLQLPGHKGRHVSGDSGSSCG